MVGNDEIINGGAKSDFSAVISCCRVSGKTGGEDGKVHSAPDRD